MSLLVRGLSREEVRDAILSDATRFAGANIDAKISEAEEKPAVVAQGALAADGTEQQVAELISVTPAKFSGWISLANMDTGDRITIKTYARDESWAYQIHAIENYEDALAQPMVNLTVKLAEAYRVTLQQTAGIMRSYSYRFYKEG